MIPEHLSSRSIVGCATDVPDTRPFVERQSELLCVRLAISWLLSDNRLVSFPYFTGCACSFHDLMLNSMPSPSVMIRKPSLLWAAGLVVGIFGLTLSHSFPHTSVRSPTIIAVLAQLRLHLNSITFASLVDDLFDMRPKNWVLLNFRARSLYGMEYTLPQQVEVGSSVHLALDELQSRNLALDLASAPRQAQGCTNSGFILL